MTQVGTEKDEGSERSVIRTVRTGEIILSDVAKEMGTI